MSTMRRSFITLLTVSFVVAGMPVAPPARAQTPAACDAAIDALERETHQLGAQLEQDVKEFVRTDAAETALKGIRNRYKSNPTSEALFDLKDKWDKWNEYVDYLKNARVTLEDLQRCLNTRGCSLNEFAMRQHEAIAKWIQSLGDEGINAATERVNKAAKLIQNYVDDTLDLAIGGALATVQQCNVRFEQQAVTTTSQTVTPPAGPSAGTTPPNAVGKTSGGGGMGTALLGVAGAAAAGIGTWLALQKVDDDTTSTSTPTTTRTTPTTTTPPTTTSCSHLGSSGSCGVQVQIDAQAYAQTLTSAKRFNVYSVPRGANVTACQLQTTICFGIGCPGTGVRQTGASLRGLGTMTDATVTIVPIDSATPGTRSWNVNLTQCALVVRYP